MAGGSLYSGYDTYKVYKDERSGLYSIDRTRNNSKGEKWTDPEFYIIARTLQDLRLEVEKILLAVDLRIGGLE